MKDCINVLAGRQAVSERKMSDYDLKIEALKEKLQVAVNSNNFELAQKYLNSIRGVEDEKEEYEDELTRFCYKCGKLLRTHSINWYEGFHIDGCE